MELTASRGALRLALCGALALFVSACATTGDLEPVAAASPTALVSGTEIAARLGLVAQPLDDAGKVALTAADGDSILLFVDTRIVAVHGQQYTTSEPVRWNAGDVWIPGDDASRIESVWAIENHEPADWMPPPLPVPPRTGRPSTPAPAPSATRLYGDQPTAADVKAWTVKLRRTWRYIVIHHSATESGNAASFHASHLKRGWEGLGYQFVIDNGNGGADGAVEVGFRWREQKQGAHAGTGSPRNADGIGICLVGDFTKTRPTAAQMRSLARLCNFLSGLCRIPRENYLLHGDVRDTQCPGDHFPRDFVTQHRSGGVAARGTK